MKKLAAWLLLLALLPTALGARAAAPEPTPGPQIVYYNSYADLRDAHPDVTDWRSGCYVCSIAMILTTMGKVNAAPYDIWRLNGEKSYIASWSAVARAYNVSTSQVALDGTAEQREAAITAVCAQNPYGLFLYGTRNSGSNHAVVAYLDAEGTLRIHNPGYYGYDACRVGPDDPDFAGYDQFYAYRTFTDRGPQPLPTPAPTPAPTPDLTPEPSPAPQPGAGADQGGVEGFVARLYSLCLGRAPRDGEDASWVDDLAYGVKTGSECAYGFYFSQEFTSKNYSNAEYVTLLYRAMMGREPDEGGLQDWVGRLAAGTPREVVFNGFVGSQEFTNLCASYGIVRGDGDGISAFVDRLYRVCFNRGPDVVGFNDWTARLRTQTATGTEVAHGFACSQEMANLGLNDEQYVEAMYRAFFDREYDAAGKADWLDRMHTQGYDREQVFYGFAGSQEFANLCARYGILRG